MAAKCVEGGFDYKSIEQMKWSVVEGVGGDITVLFGAAMVNT